MNSLLGIVSAALLTLLVLVPVAAAADRSDLYDEHILFSNGGDITLGADQTVDLLVVVGGTATIEGDPGAVVVINGTANFIGSRTTDIFAIASDVSLDGGTVVAGDVRSFDSTLARATGATVEGTIGDLGISFADAMFLAGPALFLIYLAFAISAIGAGVLLAGLAGRQVRKAEAVISREPGTTILAALAGFAGLIVAGVLAIVTVVGIPLGLGILALVLPLLLVTGYLVAGIWIGDVIVSQSSPGVQRDRPYLAALVGLTVLGAASIIPGVGAIASIIGFGAVALLMWRTMRGETDTSAIAGTPVPVASAS